MKLRVLSIPLIALALLLAACQVPSSGPAATDSASTKRVASTETVLIGGLSVEHEVGVLGKGATYEIWTPPAAARNGELVIYAHGYANTSQPVALSSDLEAMLPTLIGMGFAAAQSSYSENGWAVKDGAIRVRQLRDYFAEKCWAPTKVYLIGVSEGALISTMLLEKNPELFDGALCIGGPLGGASMEIKYIYDLRVIFDALFGAKLAYLAGTMGPGSLAGILESALGSSALAAAPPAGNVLPAEGLAFAQLTVPLLLGLFASSPIETAALASMVVDGLPLFNWASAPGLSQVEMSYEMAITLAVGLWYNIFGTEDILGRTHGHTPVDNRASVYLVGATGQTLAVERLQSTADATNYLAHWYQPTGELARHLVILHNSRDPIVPIYHERAYLAMAAAAGKASMVKAVEIPYFGHCQILSYPYSTPDAASFAAYVMGGFNTLLDPTWAP